MAATQTKLDEAEDALHSIQIGGQARVVVDQNGERVEYSVASVPRLKQYILEMKIELGQATIAGPLKPGFKL